MVLLLGWTLLEPTTPRNSMTPIHFLTGLAVLLLFIFLFTIFGVLS